MAFIQYLTFDGENLPLPNSYEVNLEDKEADSGGETEALYSLLPSVPLYCTSIIKW